MTSSHGSEQLQFFVGAIILFISASRTRCFLASSLNTFILFGIGFIFNRFLNNLITFAFNCSTFPVSLFVLFVFFFSNTHTFFKSRVNSSLPVSICFNTLHRRFEIGRPSRNFSATSTAAS